MLYILWSNNSLKKKKKFDSTNWYLANIISIICKKKKNQHKTPNKQTEQTKKPHKKPHQQLTNKQTNKNQKLATPQTGI